MSEITPQTLVCAASGANELLAADPSCRYRITHLAIWSLSATPVNISLINGDHDCLFAAASPLTIDMTGTSGPPSFVLPLNLKGWFETDTKNEALTLTLSGAVKVAVAFGFEIIEEY